MSLLVSGYVLEVCEFIVERDGENGWLQLGGKHKHIGYMKARFKTKKDAVTYYDRHNPHMRSLNAHGTYQSDWDPNTKLFYIVRKNHGIIDTVNPFSLDDLPTQVISDNSSQITYKMLS